MTQVDVITPTIGRQELRRAIASVRAQTIPARHLVTLDDPRQEETVKSWLPDPGSEMALTRGRQGPAAARNMGVNLADAPFVAFLDDDDWWEPTKLAKQLAAIAAPSAFSDQIDGSRRISFTRTYFHRANGRVDAIPLGWPKSAHEIPDYLVARRSLTFGSGFLQTSSLLASRAMLQETPWDASVGHEDWDLIIRLTRSPSVSVHFVDEPLTHVQQASAGSLSRESTWLPSWSWFERHSSKLSPRAQADFIHTQLIRAALRERNARRLIAAARRLKGRPHLAAALIAASGLAPRPRR